MQSELPTFLCEMTLRCGITKSYMDRANFPYSPPHHSPHNKSFSQLLHRQLVNTPSVACVVPPSPLSILAVLLCKRVASTDLASTVEMNTNVDLPVVLVTIHAVIQYALESFKFSLCFWKFTKN
jgi:hypothetical protein